MSVAKMAEKSSLSGEGPSAAYLVSFNFLRPEFGIEFGIKLVIEI